MITRNQNRAKKKKIKELGFYKRTFKFHNKREERNEQSEKRKEF